MNIKLVKYGINEYETDFCIHIGIITQMLFLYKTKVMQELICKNNFRIVSAFQNKIETARGLLVPWNTPSIKSVALPKFKNKYSDQADTTLKGKWAVSIAKRALQLGMVPLTFDIKEITNKDMQIKGNDIIAIGSFSIQVKCDWFAGPKNKGGTGNLFIQTHECNPFKKH